jgi:hypothetical protein
MIIAGPVSSDADVAWGVVARGYLVSEAIIAECAG